MKAGVAGLWLVFPVLENAGRPRRHGAQNPAIEVRRMGVGGPDLSSVGPPNL